MKAETAYNVIQALSPEEVPKLYELLGLSKQLKEEPNKKLQRKKEIALAKERMLIKIFSKKRIP